MVIVAQYQQIIQQLLREYCSIAHPNFQVQDMSLRLAPQARVYLGHMQDQLTGTSNGGAVTHATGTKVHAESFGLEEDNQTPTTALSGKQQTI